MTTWALGLFRWTIQCPPNCFLTSTFSSRVYFHHSSQIHSLKIWFRSCLFSKHSDDFLSWRKIQNSIIIANKPLFWLCLPPPSAPARVTSFLCCLSTENLYICCFLCVQSLYQDDWLAYCCAFHICVWCDLLPKVFPNHCIKKQDNTLLFLRYSLPLWTCLFFFLYRIHHHGLAFIYFTTVSAMTEWGLLPINTPKTTLLSNY